MAAAVVWSHEALDDLTAIAEYIGRDSVNHARRFVEEAFALADSLSESPMRGRVVPELSVPSVRERFIFSYRLIYGVEGDRVQILALVHGRRLLEPLEQRFG